MMVGRRVGVAGLRIFIVASLILVGSHAGGAEITLVNTLATATSPYLREAATQPVAWHPWGAEAFKLAKALDRPILLDIGAIWCHWCQVMDVETSALP